MAPAHMNNNAADETYRMRDEERVDPIDEETSEADDDAAFDDDDEDEDDDEAADDDELEETEG